MSRPDVPRFNFDHATPDEIAFFLAKAALAAGPAVMEVYALGGRVQTKSDGSPVTLADRRAEQILCERLRRATPETPMIAEEGTSEGKTMAVADRFWLIDPLDGTREFLARNGEFTINVALVEKGVPIAGAVYAPALARLWFGASQAFVCGAPVGMDLPGAPAWRRIRTRRAPSGLAVLASRSHGDPQTEAFLEQLPVAERRSIGSSLKFCLIAEGLADVYPRFGPTMEWDTAAGDAILRAAGGTTLGLNDASLAYGKIDRGLRNGAFVAWGDREAARLFGHR